MLTLGLHLSRISAKDRAGRLNLGRVHNDLVSLAHMPSDMRFTQDFISSAACDGICEYESTSYTGMVNIPGTDRILVSCKFPRRSLLACARVSLTWEASMS